jgi:hypothetical protein
MRRLILIAALLAIACGGGNTDSNADAGNDGEIDAGTIPPQDFVSLAASDWGTNANPASNNLTARMPTWSPLPLPLDTSGWTQDSSLAGAACDENTFGAIQAAYNAAAENTVIVLPDCTIPVVQVNPQNSNIWNLAVKDGIELRGQDNTKFMVTVPDGFYDVANLPREGLDANFMVVGAREVNPITTCNWVGGFDLGSKKLELDPGCGLSSSGDDGWYASDLVDVRTDAFPGQGPTMQHRITYRITCVDGSAPGEGDRVGSSDGCALLDGDNQIAIDRPLYLDYNDGAYYFGNIPGKRVELTERKGGGALTNNIAENIGFRNIEFEHEYAYTLDARTPPIKFQAVADAWVIGNTFQKWGGAWIMYQRSASRILTRSNTFIGPLWRTRCVSEIVSVAQTNPAQVTVATGACADHRWNGFFEATLWFSENVDEPALAGNFLRYSVITPPTNGQAVLELPGIDGSAFNGNPGGFVSNLNSWNIGASYSNGGTNEVQMIDNIYVNPRVGPLLQGGAAAHVIAYNYLITDVDQHCSRGVFFHGNGSGAANLIEGNDMDCAMVPYASSNRDDDGEGIYMTLFQNRWRDTGDGTAHGGLSNYPDQCPRGTLCIQEQTNQRGASTEFTNVIGNVFYDFAQANTDFDSTINNGEPNGPSEEPYFLWNLYFAKNLFYSGNDIDDNFDSGNQTTLKPDVEAGDDNEGTSAVEAYQSFTPPTSLFLTEIPDFWCVESPDFPNIGAFYDDMAGTYAKLPAQRRHDGDQCN